MKNIKYLITGVLLGTVIMVTVPVLAQEALLEDNYVALKENTVKEVRSPEYKKRNYDLSKSRDENLRLDVSQYTDIEVSQNNTDRIVQQLQRIESILIKINDKIK